MTEYDRGFNDALKEAIAICKEKERQLLWREGQTLPIGDPTLLSMASIANGCAYLIDKIVRPKQ
jgi:hypothetical protein